MTVILISNETEENNSKHGYVIELFDTIKEFKNFLKEELKNIFKEFTCIDLCQNGDDYINIISINDNESEA